MIDGWIDGKTDGWTEQLMAGVYQEQMYQEPRTNEPKTRLRAFKAAFPYGIKKSVWLLEQQSVCLSVCLSSLSHFHSVHQKD